MLERAVYGRMRLGRCIVHDLGYLGCQRDVLLTARCAVNRRPTLFRPARLWAENSRRWTRSNTRLPQGTQDLSTRLLPMRHTYVPHQVCVCL